MTNLITAFVENRHELWLFTVSRPIKQSVLSFIFNCIRKQSKIRENTYPLIFKIQDIFNSYSNNEDIINKLYSCNIGIEIIDKKTYKAISLIRKIFKTNDNTKLLLALKECVKYVSSFEYIIDEQDGV